MPFHMWKDTPTLLSFALVYKKLERLKNNMSDNESENSSSQAPVAGPSKQETAATALYSYVPSNFQVPAPVVFQRESCSQLGRFRSSTWSGQTKFQGTIGNFTLSDGKRLSSKSQRTSMNEHVGKLLEAAMQFKVDRLQIIVVAKNITVLQLFISRMPKMWAIPQLVSAPLNPIPTLEHFRRSHPQCEHSHGQHIYMSEENNAKQN